MASVAAVAEKLNNAIVSLAWLNPTTPPATILAEHWERWWTTHRVLLPDAAWYAVLKTFWFSYATARAVSPVVTERTPPANSLDPAMWKLAVEYVRRYGDDADWVVTSTGDVVRKAERSAAELADRVEARVRALPEAIDRLKEEIGDVAENVLFVTSALAIAFIVWRWR